MGWFTSPHLHKRQDRLQKRFAVLEDDVRTLRHDLADTSQDVRRLDLDIVGLEDRVKAFTGRLSVRKRKDRQPEAAPEPEPDLNRLIRDGKLTKWP